MSAKRILTVADKDVQVVVFTNKDGSAEAVLTNPEKPTKLTKISIDAPPKGFKIVTTRHPTGEVEIMYRSDV